MTAIFRSPFPHQAELTGYRRQRLDDQRPHPDSHYRTEREFHRVAALHRSFGGGYWTGEAVDHHDLVPFDPSQLRQKDLGLRLGDQIAVLYRGRWVAGFVGVIGDPDDAWSTMLSAPAVLYEENGDLTALPLDDPARSLIPTSLQTTLVLEAAKFQTMSWEGRPLPQRGVDPKITCIPWPNEPFIDITVSVADGQGITGRLFDERQLITDPRNWRNNFCCSYEVVRVYRSELHAFLREIDGATVVIHRETKKVLRRLSTSSSQQEAFLQRMPVQRRYPEESVGRNYGRSGNHDGLYGSRSQREPSRNKWGDSRVRSDDSSHLSCQQERFAFSGTFRGRPVGRDYKPASESQKPVVEVKPVVKSDPAIEFKPAVTSKSAIALTSVPTELSALKLRYRANRILAPLDLAGLMYNPDGSFTKLYEEVTRDIAILGAQLDRFDTVSDADLSQSYRALSTSLAKSQSAVQSISAVKSKPVVKSKPAVKSEPVVKSKPTVASRPAVKPMSVVNLKSPDGPASSFMKFVQSLYDPAPAAVPKPAVMSPSVVQSTPDVKSKPAVKLVKLPELQSPVKSKSDIDSKSLVAPTPVVELPPRSAAAPDQQGAIGFAMGWTSRTSDDLHSSAVADCVKKYVEVQPRPTRRPRPRRLRMTSHASKKDGDQFRAARQQSLPVGTPARRQFDGRSLARRDERCSGKSGSPPTTRPHSATFLASDDEVFFNDGDGRAYRYGALSMDPKLVDSFSPSSLTLVVDPLVESAVPPAVSPVSAPSAPRVRKPLSITKPPLVTSTTATPVVPAPITADNVGDVQPPSSELGIHSPEGVDDVAALAVHAPERVATENRVPEGAVNSTVDPTAAASTKAAAVKNSSRRASKAPAIVSEGACAEQGPIGSTVTPGDAIRRFFHRSFWK